MSIYVSLHKYVLIQKKIGREIFLWTNKEGSLQNICNEKEQGKQNLRKCIKDYIKGDLQDGGVARREDHLPPHKYIKNTSACGTTPTEHLLYAGRRPQTSQKPCGWQGLGAPAWCQVWASEVGEASSGHWTTRDLPGPRNINRRELPQRSPSQR